jgi:hypothetical protein
MSRLRAMVTAAAASAAGCSAMCAESVSPGIAPAPALQEADDGDPPTVLPRLAARLDELRRGGRGVVPYVEPTAEEASAFGAWVLAVARAARAGQEPAVSPPPGFALERLDDLWILAEQQGRRRGAGAVAVRVGPATSRIVEAPHTFFDAGTLPPALAAFRAQRARALIVNTVHRYAAVGLRPPGRGLDAEEPDEPCPSDVAHAPSSFFLAAHEALLAAEPGIWTVQLHGFSDATARGASVILSAAGTVADTAPAAGALGALLGADRVRRYPDEIRVLGGLTNVIAQSSARRGAPFLHVEIARSTRDRLLADGALLARFAAALGAGEGQ